MPTLKSSPSDCRTIGAIDQQRERVHEEVAVWEGAIIGLVLDRLKGRCHRMFTITSQQLAMKCKRKIRRYDLACYPVIKTTGDL